MQLASDVATSQTAAMEESKWVGFPIRAFIIKAISPSLKSLPVIPLHPSKATVN